MLLEGKTAIVTGASGGIGKAVAIALAKEGAAVAVHFHGNEEKALLVKKEIEEAGGKAEIFRANVADFEECNALVKAVAKTFGSIDILVNNAGIIMRKPMLEMEADEIRKVIDVDLNAVGLTLAGGLAEVVGGKCKMRFPDLKGIIQTFHKAVACIDANDLATVAVIIHG